MNLPTWQTIGVETPLGQELAQDAKNSDKNMLQLSQGGIGLPKQAIIILIPTHTAKLSGRTTRKCIYR